MSPQQPPLETTSAPPHLEAPDPAGPSMSTVEYLESSKPDEEVSQSSDTDNEDDEEDEDDSDEDSDS